MKGLMFIFVLVAIVCAVFAYVPTLPRPRPGPGFPQFPGHGPFNPKPQWPYPMPNVSVPYHLNKLVHKCCLEYD